MQTTYVLHYLCADEKFSDVARFFPMFLTYDPSLRRQWNDSGNCPLHSAATNGHVITLKELVRLNPDDVNIPNAVGNTCLHLAVTHNQQGTVEHLMKLRGIDTDLRNEDNKTACDVARDLNRTSAYSAVLFTHVSDVSAYCCACIAIFSRFRNGCVNRRLTQSDSKGVGEGS